MRRVRTSFAAIGLLSLASSACSSGQTSGTGGPGPSDGSTGTSTSELAESTTTAIPDGTGTGEPGEGSSSGAPPSGSSSSDGGPASTDEGCPPGSDGCPCSAGICDGDLACIDDTCQVACDGDVFEPNDDEASAVDLGEINDNDGNGGVLSASLHHAGDVDWYFYTGNDDITGNVDPARALVASGGLRLCKFLECDNGLAETEFECPPGTQYALSTMARPGCCANDGFGLEDLNCTGVIEDNATVVLRVDQPEPACVTYSISYHY
jgi:hypothetical protein